MLPLVQHTRCMYPREALVVMVVVMVMLMFEARQCQHHLDRRVCVVLVDILLYALDDWTSQGS